MMRLPRFRLERPATLEEAAAILAEAPENTRLVAGGTDLWPNMKRRHQSAETVVSLADVSELHGVCENEAGELVIGAMTTLTEIATDRRVVEGHPGFAKAVGSISAPVLRNMGTLGGNLCLDTRCTYYNQNEEWRRSIDYCMKEKGEVCWVAPSSPRCWAVSSTDAAPVAVALGARATLVSKDGTRTVDLEALYRDDGIDYLTKRRDEILVSLTLPKPGAWKSTYWKLRRRGSIDFPVLGVGVALRFDGKGKVEEGGIVLGAVRSAPVRAEESEKAILGAKITEESAAQAGVLARKPASPLDNTDFVHIWRAKMVERYVEGALRELAGLPEKAKTSTHGSWVF